MWDEITYQFQNLNGTTVEVSEWINNLILHFSDYLSILGLNLNHVNKMGPWSMLFHADTYTTNVSGHSTQMVTEGSDLQLQCSIRREGKPDTIFRYLWARDGSYLKQSTRIAQDGPNLHIQVITLTIAVVSGCQLDEPLSFSSNRQRNTFVKLLYKCCAYGMCYVVFFWN